MLLHFVYMLVTHKRQSAFVKQSADAFGKDLYCRFLKERRFNWRKPLLLSAVKLIARIEPLHRTGEQRLLYEALIARITLSFTHNLVGTINRLEHEPETLGELFRDLECELEALLFQCGFFWKY